MLPRQFASQKALLDYVEQKGLVYMWAYTQRERVLSPAFIARAPAFARSVRACGCAHALWRAAGIAVPEGDGLC